MKMKISFITTVNHNIGDDFVREGIKYLLKNCLKAKELIFQNIHKHSPITSRDGFEWLRNNRIGKAVDNILPLKVTKDKILDADIIIQSGAPVYWCHENTHCYNNEWYEPLIKRRWLKHDKKAILLNIAAGSCQTYYSNGMDFCDNCKTYIKELYKYSNLTIVRDRLAQKILNTLGLSSKLLPCTSIFAIDEYNLKNKGEDYVAVNYMKGGGHYSFGQKIDFKKWEQEFKKFYLKLKEKERVVMVCHNQKEVYEAVELDPEAEIFYVKNDYLKYMEFYSKAKFGIMNRIHGAFLMASFGKPSVIIGSDSRALMAETIGLKYYFVNKIDYELLNKEYEFLKNGADSFAERFKNIKEKAFNEYIQSLSVVCLP